MIITSCHYGVKCMFPMCVNKHASVCESSVDRVSKPSQAGRFPW